MPSITGMTRSSSCSGGTGAAPGRVDSPPTSMIAAPSPTSRRAWTIADDGIGERPAVRERVRRDVDDAHDRERRHVIEGSPCVQTAAARVESARTGADSCRDGSPGTGPGRAQHPLHDGAGRTRRASARPGERSAGECAGFRARRRDPRAVLRGPVAGQLFVAPDPLAAPVRARRRISEARAPACVGAELGDVRGLDGDARARPGSPARARPGDAPG